jgi:3-hydroxy-9,10-secoandrosta-1,3,5(10)-triene-9,17-dione monooxygenase reductase component
MSIDPRAFRNALGTFATGVTIVTTQDRSGYDVGVTANSFNSVSLEPPLVLWSLAKASASLAAFMEADYFAVHILAANQDALSNQFAKPGHNKFADLKITRGLQNIPLLADCAARFQCKVEFRYEGGDHVIFVGQVQEFEHSGHAPLVYHGGRYAMAVRMEPATATPPGVTPEPDSSFSQDFLIYLLGRAHHQLFLGLRRELNRFGLSEDGWFVLSLLGVSDNRTLAELDRLLAHTGKRVRDELIANLAASDFLLLHGPFGPHSRVTLTDAGRHAVIELVAAGKAIEDHATQSFDKGEQLLLKQALRNIIRATDSGADLRLGYSSADDE